MASQKLPPWPDQWTRRRHGFGISSVVLFGAMTVLCVYAPATDHVDPRAKILGFGFPLMAGFFVLGVFQWLRVRSRGSRGFRTGVHDELGPVLDLPSCVT